MNRRRRQLTNALLTAFIGLRVVRGSRALAAGRAPSAPSAPNAPNAPNAPRTLLDVKDPAAKAVSYQEDARKVDPGLYPTYRRGQSCNTCALIEFGTAPLRGCTLFPGKLIVAAGWCSAWQLRGRKS